jgi:predicted double-glycine peptidase
MTMEFLHPTGCRIAATSPDLDVTRRKGRAGVPSLPFEHFPCTPNRVSRHPRPRFESGGLHRPNFRLVDGADPARYTSRTRRLEVSQDGWHGWYEESRRRRASVGVRRFDLGVGETRRGLGEGPRCHWLEVNRNQGQVLSATGRPLSESGSTARDLALVRQRRGNDCGPAALATIAAHHGRAFDYDEFCNQAELGFRGTDLLSLSRLAEGLGFRARGVKGSYDAMSTCRLPAIAHFRRPLGGGHFVVVHSWTSGGVVLADPGCGLRKLSRRAFSRRWTGYLLLVQ